MSTSSRITEVEMADVVKGILSTLPNESATFAELRDIVPKHVKLSRADRKKSTSRPAEQVWVQIVRNLIAHGHEWFVSVQGGIKLEWRGKAPPPPATKSARRAT